MKIPNNTADLWLSVMNKNMIKRPGAQRCLMIYFSCYLAHERDAEPGKLDSTAEQQRDLD